VLAAANLDATAASYPAPSKVAPVCCASVQTFMDGKIVIVEVHLGVPILSLAGMTTTIMRKVKVWEMTRMSTVPCISPTAL